MIVPNYIPSDTVGGPAKSESPVENGGVSHPIIYRLSTIQNRWCRISQPPMDPTLPRPLVATYQCLESDRNDVFSGERPT